MAKFSISAHLQETSGYGDESVGLTASQSAVEGSVLLEVEFRFGKHLHSYNGVHLTAGELRKAAKFFEAAAAAAETGKFE